MSKKVIDMFDFCEENNITPNELYILWCMYVKSHPKLTNIHSEIRNLVRSDRISSDYKILDAGKVLVDKLKKKYNVKTINVNFEENLPQYIDKYLDLFPKGKLPSGKSARVNKTDIEKSFRWFFKTYEYDWDTVLKATAYYVDTFEKNKFLYMRNSQYFIRKQITGVNFESDLANYCDIILNGGHEDDISGLTEKVV